MFSSQVFKGIHTRNSEFVLLPMFVKYSKMRLFTIWKSGYGDKKTCPSLEKSLIIFWHTFPVYFNFHLFYDAFCVPFLLFKLVDMGCFLFLFQCIFIYRGILSEKESSFFLFLFWSSNTLEEIYPAKYIGFYYSIYSVQMSKLHLFIYFMHVLEHTCHGKLVEIRGQPLEVNSFCPPCELQRLNIGYQVCSMILVRVRGWKTRGKRRKKYKYGVFFHISTT